MVGVRYRYIDEYTDVTCIVYPYTMEFIDNLTNEEIDREDLSENVHDYIKKIRRAR